MKVRARLIGKMKGGARLSETRVGVKLGQGVGIGTPAGAAKSL
ncbi:hypothetical protein Z947_1071 [Sulfitobacter geojensis]|nr:hypothetical protein Z947_1071 [Sulfitobacter geojensis]